jgi:uncharacterized protein (DUF302 family)
VKSIDAFIPGCNDLKYAKKNVFACLPHINHKEMHMFHKAIAAQCTMKVLMTCSLLLYCVAWMTSGPAQAQSSPENQPQFVHVVLSHQSFAQTLQSFKKELAQAGWSVVNVTNMSGMLSEKGFTLDPLMILDVCSGKYSAQVLSDDAYRPISAFMPCRVSIYKTSDGNVFISRMNTSAFLESMPPEVAKIMSVSDDEIAAVIAKAVKE